MIPEYRHAFNQAFTEEKYQSFLHDITDQFDYVPGFRISESPVFIPDILKARLLQACEDIMKVIQEPDFKERTEGAFSDTSQKVPGEGDASTFVQFDFGICLDDEGQPIPKLIELQGFPSLYFFQHLLDQMYRKHYEIPEGVTIFPTGISREEFIGRLREEIIGDVDPKQVILLEIEPEKQATAIDFYCAEAALGLKVLCISKLKKKGRELYYVGDDGEEVRVLRIFNRIIFDELDQRPDLEREFNFTDDVDVEWIGHPNWFFRISKYTLPMLKGEFVPKAYFLNEIASLPEDLENYVLKPLFSFAGAGVHINVTKELIDNLEDRSKYLLQEKVNYGWVIDTLDQPSRVEVRMMLLHNSKDNTTKVVSNLCRMSKGEMVGVKYNKDKTWVGGSTGYF